METTTFTALCERAGRWWTIRVPQVEGLARQVRTLDQAEIMARQSIAQSLGIPPESIRVEVLPDAPVEVEQALQARHAAVQALEAAAQATRAALTQMARDGYTFEDAVTMLGLSPAEIELYASHAVGGPGLRGASGPMQMADQ
jgi:DNA-directed RNA polymerase specialized sigma24 family protein